jgi:ATP-binding cassette subfamily F protein 3
LDSDERIEKPLQSWQMKLMFDQPEHQSQNMIIMDRVNIGYEGFRPLITNLSLTIHSGERIILTGENGGGKTSLLRTIAGIIKPLEGSIRFGPSIRLGYMAQEQELLPFDRTSVEIIQQIAPLNETEVRTFLHYFLFSGDDPLRVVGSLSYGERSRLSLAVLVAQGSNMLILDEPINHLDIPSRSRFEEALSHFDGTILAVVHDRYFIKRFATQVWILRDGQINQLAPDRIVENRLS